MKPMSLYMDLGPVFDTQQILEAFYFALIVSYNIATGAIIYHVVSINNSTGNITTLNFSENNLINSINYSVLFFFFSFELDIMFYVINNFFTFLFYILFTLFFSRYLRSLSE